MKPWKYSATIVLLLSLFLLLPGHSRAADPNELIGKTSINFNVVTTEDRLLNYGPEYYGKYYLIMTFFPAAFTPV